MAADRSDDEVVPAGTQVARRQRDPAFLRAEADIAEARERVALSVMKLEQELSRAIDWREWVRRRPGRCLTAAFVVGWLLGRRQ
jgi:hypothetical protein